jgi:hypothetical protein
VHLVPASKSSKIQSDKKIDELPLPHIPQVLGKYGNYLFHHRLSKFESEYIERPNNAMTRDEKFKELQSLLSPFDSETFIKEIELLD